MIYLLRFLFVAGRGKAINRCFVKIRHLKEFRIFWSTIAKPLLKIKSFLSLLYCIMIDGSKMLLMQKVRAILQYLYLFYLSEKFTKCTTFYDILSRILGFSFWTIKIMHCDNFRQKKSIIF